MLTNAGLVNAIHDGATLNLWSSGSHTGRVAFGDNDLNEVVLEFTINGMPLRAGLYTSNNLPNWITGAGGIQVPPRGLVLMVR